MWRTCRWTPDQLNHATCSSGGRWQTKQDVFVSGGFPFFGWLAGIRATVESGAWQARQVSFGVFLLRPAWSARAVIAGALRPIAERKMKIPSTATIIAIKIRSFLLIRAERACRRPARLIRPRI